MRTPSRTLLLWLPAALLALSACAGPTATAAVLRVEVLVDGQRAALEVPSGTTVQGALTRAGVTLGALDRVTPPGYTVLDDGTVIEVTRVAERFDVETVVIPFERQTIRNEALPEGERRLLQPGQNGRQEITYRILEQAGEEVSRVPVQSVVVEAPVAEIVMIGAQAVYSNLPLDGTLAYLASGNAWVMRGSTGSRRPLVVSGDLDGRVFRLSPDGRWLLFTRRADEDGEINSLWAVSTTEPDAQPVSLRARNIVHFADWAPTPGALTLAYSTAEPSPSPPGWQAHNDLHTLTLSATGQVIRQREVVPPQAGGQYGWWGTSYAWANDVLLAFARADSVGLIDLREPALRPLLEIVPLQTLGDWAWVPGMSWSPDGRILYAVDHAPPQGLESPAASQAFDLVALPGEGGPVLRLARNTGMFASPVVSPPRRLGHGEFSYTVAFLQALAPLESADSRYRLILMDRDGSNQRALFPPPGEVGLAPQRIAWSPAADRLAVLYRGDLWLVDVEAGAGQPVTGDGQTLALDWTD